MLGIVELNCIGILLRPLGDRFYAVAECCTTEVYVGASGGFSDRAQQFNPFQTQGSLACHDHYVMFTLRGGSNAYRTFRKPTRNAMRSCLSTIEE